jgi:D-alanyl-D-alanine carboxypeptidase
MKEEDGTPDSRYTTALGIPADYGRQRGLPHQLEAPEFVSLGPNPGGREVLLLPAAAQAWTRMQASAREAAIELVAISGFRSVEHQAAIIRNRLAAGEKIEAILRLVAAPGYSEHHTGRAVDIGVPDAPPLTEAFAATPAFRWLEENAGRFGFTLSFPRGNPHGIAFEPWHWCLQAPGKSPGGNQGAKSP